MEGRAMIFDPQEPARRILAAFDALIPVAWDPPLDLTSVQAYALQAEVARLREERGEKVIGYKVGCASEAIQRQLGIHEPIFGRIFDTGRIASGTRISSAMYAGLTIEGELAVLLGTDLPGHSLADGDYLSAISAIFLVIELHHYTPPGPWSSCQDLITSNGMHAGFVRADPSACRPLALLQGMSIHINENEADRTARPWTMTGPATILRWLAGRLDRFGLRLRQGQVILTGSPMGLHPVAPGSRIVIASPPLGSVCVDVVW